jgi:hypothetical protein
MNENGWKWMKNIFSQKVFHPLTSILLQAMGADSWEAGKTYEQQYAHQEASHDSYGQAVYDNYTPSTPYESAIIRDSYGNATYWDNRGYDNGGGGGGGGGGDGGDGGDGRGDGDGGDSD